MSGDASGGSPAGEGGATAWASRSSSPVSSVTMSSRLAPRLSILSAARLTTCSSSRTFPARVAAQGFFRAGAEPQAAQAQARTVAFQEAARQQQDVIAAFSQWGIGTG